MGRSGERWLRREERNGGPGSARRDEKKRGRDEGKKGGCFALASPRLGGWGWEKLSPPPPPPPQQRRSLTGWLRGAAPPHSARPRLPPTRPRCPPPAAGPSRSEGTRALPPRPPASPRQPLGEEEAARLRHRQPLGRERGAGGCPPRGRRARGGVAAGPGSAGLQAGCGPLQCAVAKPKMKHLPIHIF
ncbi:uncharacterized protein ACIB01_010208 [Guaruba guarouba]